MTAPANDLDHEREDVEGLEDKIDVANTSTAAYNGESHSAATLLPSPLASLVSLTTATSLLSLRAVSFLGSFAINAARTGTLTGFELGRVILEGLLTRAGNDLATSSTGAIGQAAAEGLLQKALLTLHSSITSTAFLVSTGFQIGSTSLTSSLSIAQYFLSALDAIVGDTQSSRAVATIVSLVQREFKDPHTGLHGERVGLADILVGTIAFVILQRWGQKQTQQELDRAEVQETIWDIVVVPEGSSSQSPEADSDDGYTSDEEELQPTRTRHRRLTRTTSFMSVTGREEAFDAVGDGRSFVSASSLQANETMPGTTFRSAENALRYEISSQLPPGTNVSLNAESRTRDIITVDLDIDEDLQLEAPQGFVLVSSDRRAGPTRRLVFQRTSKKRRRASFVANIDMGYGRPSSSLIEDVSVDPNTQPAHRPLSTETTTTAHSTPDDAPASPIVANQKRARTPLRRTWGASSAPSNPTTEDAIPVNADLPQLAAQTPLRKSLRHKKSVRRLVDFWNREPKLPIPRSQDSTQQPPQQATLERIQRAGAILSPKLSVASNDPTSSRDEDRLGSVHQVGRPGEGSRHHRRRRSSFYTVMTDDSDWSLVLHPHGVSIELSVGAQLRRNGVCHGSFPPRPLTSSLARFAKFAIASYGSTFLRLTNSWQDGDAMPPAHDVPPQHHSFASYINLPPSSVLISSHVDSHGGNPASLDPDHGLPLVNFVSIDHETQSVVLTCRGTLGFEDILTDLTGDYDDVRWQGTKYKVHKGILASARRLLTLPGGRVLATIKSALEEFDSYGLVLCGHSLGGSVAATLAILLATKSTTSASGDFNYCTSRDALGASGTSLPANRPIQAYAYGPAACFSPMLQQATRGLVTTVVLGQDAVPYLSLGTLLDFQTMALAFKTDSHDAKAEIVRRIKDGIYSAFHDRSGLGAFRGLFADEGCQSTDPQQDHWPWIALKSLRASMLADKLVPPGEVFHVESQPVLQRHAFVGSSSTEKGSRVGTGSFRPATHIKLTHIVDVETAFREMEFGASMFADHFPGRYEKVLQLLDIGLGRMR